MSRLARLGSIHLVRLAWAQLGAAPPEPLIGGFKRKNVGVSIVGGTDGKPGAYLLAADMPLTSRPESRAGELVVPDEPRLEAEEALEAVGDFLAVSNGTGCTLTSPSGFAVAFRTSDGESQAWLRSHSGLASSAEGRHRARFHPSFDAAILAELEDREQGVALLAEAVTHSHALARFRALVRVFESGFGESSGRLVVPVAQFLSARPALGYSKTEVKRWLIRLRGPAVHADRHAVFLREREISLFIDRMLFAAYEVLLNKADWGTPAVERRSVWTPEYGPLDPCGQTLFAIAGARMSAAVQLFDQFGSFPVSMSFPDFTLNDCWPSSATRMGWPEPLRVFNQDELAISSIS